MYLCEHLPFKSECKSKNLNDNYKILIKYFLPYMTNNYKTIMFDFGGVLVDLDQNKCVNAFVSLGVADIKDYIGKYSQNGLFLELEKGTISVSEFCDKLRETSHITATNEQITQAWNQFLISIPSYKLQFIHELRKQKRIILLSNTNEIHYEGWAINEFRKDGLSVDDYFDHCYLSYRLGYAKPDEEIFRKVLAGEQAQAEDILFIDDGPQNIETAQRLGFQTLLVADKEDWREKLVFRN